MRIGSDREASSSSSSSASRDVETIFGSLFAREGEDIRDRFLPDPPSDIAPDPLEGVDGMIFSSNLKLISLTIVQAVIVSKC